MKNRFLWLLFPVLAAAFTAAADNAGMSVPSVASEFPEGIVAGGGGQQKQFDLHEIVVYKKLPDYAEAPCLANLVQQGKLPPVEQRLPEEPAVIQSAVLPDGIGTYGGVFANVFACPIEGWNYSAGVTCGWFGIDSIAFQSLTKSGPVFMRNDKIEPIPNLSTGWEWTDDGKGLVMHLLKGAKWSDGVPFTADDVMFTWEDNILDPQVISWTSRSTWQINGKDIHLEKIDDYTIKWTFPVAYPVYMLWNMDEQQMVISPAHIFKPLHPRYNRKATYASFRDAVAPTALPVVTMGPWVPVEYKTDELLVMRRNPYFWKVDEEGHQLPYIDEVQFTYASTGVSRTVNTLAGICDVAHVENPETFDDVVRRVQQKQNALNLTWGPETLSFNLSVNQSATFGVSNDRDRALRELFRDVKFRRALSHAIDREGISRSLTSGPFFRGYPGGIYPGSQFFDRKAAAYWDYNPDAARSLLAEIGLRDTDRDGILNYTDGPMAGKNVNIVVIGNQDQSAPSSICQALVPMFAEVGLKVIFKEVLSTVSDEALRTGKWEMRVARGEQSFAVPNTRFQDIAPLTNMTPNWHREGAEPRQLLPFEKELNQIVSVFAQESDFSRQKALMSRYEKIFTENVYDIGIIIGRYGLLTNAHMKNVPVGCPAFFYQWSHDNMFMSALWFQPEDQRKEIMPGTVPVYH